MNTATNPEVKPLPYTAEPRAFMGSENKYCALYCENLGDKFGLRVEFAETSTATGRYDREVLETRYVVDPEDAVIVADDLRHIAARHLDLMDVRREDWLPSDNDWAEAVEAAVSGSGHPLRAVPAVAAE